MRPEPTPSTRRCRAPYFTGCTLQGWGERSETHRHRSAEIFGMVRVADAIEGWVSLRSTHPTGYGLLRLEIFERARQVVGRSPMVEFIAQRLGDDGADEKEGGGHRCLATLNWLPRRKCNRLRHFLIVQLLLNLFDQFGRYDASGRRQYIPAIPQLRRPRGLVARGRSLFAVFFILVLHHINLRELADGRYGYPLQHAWGHSEMWDEEVSQH